MSTETLSPDLEYYIGKLQSQYESAGQEKIGRMLDKYGIPFFYKQATLICDNGRRGLESQIDYPYQVCVAGLIQRGAGCGDDFLPPLDLTGGQRCLNGVPQNRLDVVQVDFAGQVVGLDGLNAPAQLKAPKRFLTLARSENQSPRTVAPDTARRRARSRAAEDRRGADRFGDLDRAVGDRFVGFGAKIRRRVAEP